MKEKQIMRMCRRLGRNWLLWVFGGLCFLDPAWILWEESQGPAKTFAMVVRADPGGAVIRESHGVFGVTMLPVIAGAIFRWPPETIGVWAFGTGRLWLALRGRALNNQLGTDDDTPLEDLIETVLILMTMTWWLRRRRDEEAKSKVQGNVMA